MAYVDLQDLPRRKASDKSFLIKTFLVEQLNPCQINNFQTNFINRLLENKKKKILLFI